MPTTFPPSGLDRATGTGGLPGTPNPANAIAQQIATTFNGVGTFFEEEGGSPQFNFGEQGTVRHVFWCDQANTFPQMIPLIQRGQVYTDSQGDISKVLDTTVSFFKPNLARIEITCEGLNWGVPPDEFSAEPQEINPDIMKHPRYNYGPAGANLSSGYGLTAQEKGVIRRVINNSSFYTANDAFNSLFNGAGVTASGPIDWTNGVMGNQVPRQMAWEIIQKNWRGEDTFYLPAIVVTYSSFFYSPQPICPGGFIDNPISSIFGPSVPYYFWSISGTDNSSPANNILQTPEGKLNNLFSYGVTYLRKCDTYQYQRTWFKLTQNWVGAPTGPPGTNPDGTVQNYIHWDPDLYAIPTTPLARYPGQPAGT